MNEDTTHTVPWGQFAAMGGAALAVASAVGIGVLSSQGLLDLGAFFELASYLVGLFGAAGAGYAASG